MSAVLKLVQSETETRTCKKCGEVKAIGEFPTKAGYFIHKCIDCNRAYRREQNKRLMADPKYQEKRSLQKKNHWAKNPDKRRGIKDRPDKLKRLYGITYADVVHALDAQHGRCANRACGREISLEVMGAKGNRAVIDHNHKTGKFRALLCSPCNVKLGVIESDENIFLGLMEYETKFSST